MNDRQLLSTLDLDVRWGDMDALGHVNNAAYLTYFESARVDWLTKVAAGASVGHGTADGPVVVNSFIEYRRPVVYPARIRVRLYCAPPGRSSFDTSYELVDAADPECLYAVGSARVVWVNHREGRSAPLPDAIRTLLPAGNRET